MVSRGLDPQEPAIVHVGTLHAGEAFNIVAGSARLSASVRTLSDAARTRVEQLIRGRVEALCAVTGITADLEYLHSCPSVINTPEAVEVACSASRALKGSVWPVGLDGGRGLRLFRQARPRPPI